MGDFRKKGAGLLRPTVAVLPRALFVACMAVEAMEELRAQTEAAGETRIQRDNGTPNQVGGFSNSIKKPAEDVYAASAPP